MNWIYSKDRLPENEGKYLITVLAGEHTFVRIGQFIPEYSDIMFGLQPSKWINLIDGNFTNVLAWAELPKPAEVRR